MNKNEQNRVVAWRLKVLRRQVWATLLGMSLDKLREWEDYYNYRRPHGALDGQTPYERLLAKKEPARVSPKVLRPYTTRVVAGA